MAKKNENKMPTDRTLLYTANEKASDLQAAYRDTYDQLINYLLKHEKDDHRLKFIAEYMTDDLLEAQEKGIAVKARVGSDYKAYIKKIEKRINFRQEEKKQRDIDYEKYTISSIWLVLMMFIALLFIRNWITEEYIISFAVDGLIGAVAIYFGIANFFTKYRVVKRYRFPDMLIYLDIIVFILCLVVKFTMPAEYGNFDITFLILVCSYLIPKKRIRYLFENVA